MNRSHDPNSSLPGTDAYRQASDEAIAIQKRRGIDVGPDWWEANVAQKLDLTTATKQAALDRDFPKD
jgi:hypothetical protein